MKLIETIKALWRDLFPRKDGYLYRLRNDGELERAPLSDPEQKPVLVEDVPDDYLSSNYEEDLADVECPYNVASLKLLHKKDLLDLAYDCGIMVDGTTRKPQLVKELADYFGI